VPKEELARSPSPKVSKDDPLILHVLASQLSQKPLDLARDPLKNLARDLPKTLVRHPIAQKNPRPLAERMFSPQD